MHCCIPENRHAKDAGTSPLTGSKLGARCNAGLRSTPCQLRVRQAAAPVTGCRDRYTSNIRTPNAASHGDRSGPIGDPNCCSTANDASDLDGRRAAPSPHSLDNVFSFRELPKKRRRSEVSAIAIGGPTCRRKAQDSSTILKLPLATVGDVRRPLLYVCGLSTLHAWHAGARYSQNKGLHL